jgi:hypothetical protein
MKKAKKHSSSSSEPTNFTQLLKEKIRKNQNDVKIFYKGLAITPAVKMDTVVAYLKKHGHLDTATCVAGAWLYFYNASIDSCTFSDRLNNTCRWIKLCVKAMTNNGKTGEENALVMLHTFFDEIIWSSGYPASANTINGLITHFFGGSISHEWYTMFLNAGLLDHIVRWMVEIDAFDAGCIKKAMSFMATQEFVRDTDFYNHLVKSIDRVLAKTAISRLTNQSIVPLLNSLLFWVSSDGVVSEHCPHNLRYAPVHGGRSVIQAWSEALATIDPEVLIDGSYVSGGLSFSVYSQSIYTEDATTGDWFENSKLIESGLDRIYSLLMINPLYRHFYPEMSPGTPKLFRTGIEPWNNLLRIHIKRKTLTTAIRMAQLGNWNSLSREIFEISRHFDEHSLRELAIMDLKKYWYDADCEEEVAYNTPEITEPIAEGELPPQPEVFGVIIDAWEAQFDVFERNLNWINLTLPNQSVPQTETATGLKMAGFKSGKHAIIPQLKSAPKPGPTLQVYQEDSPDNKGRSPYSGNKPAKKKPSSTPPPQWTYNPSNDPNGTASTLVDDADEDDGVVDGDYDFESEKKHLQTSCIHQ